MSQKLTRWTIDSVKKEALKYSSRNEFQKKSAGAYMWAYGKRLMDEVCSHMGPSKKARRFHFSTVDFSQAALRLFGSASHKSFREDYPSEYFILHRYGFDTVEIFDRKDDSKFVSELIKQFGEINRAKILGAGGQ